MNCETESTHTTAAHGPAVSAACLRAAGIRLFERLLPADRAGSAGLRGSDPVRRRRYRRRRVLWHICGGGSPHNPLFPPRAKCCTDSAAPGAQLENHLLRPEVAAAQREGEGYAVRRSDTLGSQVHYYAVRMENGNVLRVSVESASLLPPAGTIVWQLALTLAVLTGLAVLLAVILTRKILKPIYALARDGAGSVRAGRPNLSRAAPLCARNPYPARPDPFPDAQAGRGGEPPASHHPAHDGGPDRAGRNAAHPARQRKRPPAAGPAGPTANRRRWMNTSAAPNCSDV